MNSFNFFLTKQVVSVYELFKQVGELYTKDKDSFKTKLVDNFSNSNYVKDKIFKVEGIQDITSVYIPLGKYGELTLNEIANYISELKWDLVYNNSQLQVNLVPLGVHFISYNFLIKAYMKHVHNRPFPPTFNLAK